MAFVAATTAGMRRITRSMNKVRTAQVAKASNRLPFVTDRYQNVLKRAESENDTSSTKCGPKRNGEKRRVLGDTNGRADDNVPKPALKRSKTVDDSLDKLASELGCCSLNEAIIEEDIAEEFDISTDSGEVEVTSSETREENLFYCPDYSEDIISYLMEQEMTPPYMLVPDEKVLRPCTRAVLIDWLVQVQTHLRMEQETLHICVGIIDIYTSQWDIPLSQLQLLGVAALLIAAKFVQRFPPEVDELVHLTDYTYDHEAILFMEARVLKRLKFSISVPTAAAFTERFLRAAELAEHTHTSKKMKDLCAYLTDLCLVDRETIKANPSKRAAAVVALSRTLFAAEGLLGDSEVWTGALEQFSTYTYEEVFPVVRRLAKVLMRMRSLKHQGCYEKYLRQEYDSVSSWEVLSLTSPTLIAILERKG